jgi:primosomal protein N' (replication factor Y)
MVTGKMILQTRMPDNYCLQRFKKFDFKLFYRDELKFRKELEFPPYRHLVAVGLRGADEDVVFAEAASLHAELEAKIPKDMEVTEPHPDVTPKLRDKYRFTVILKGKSVKKVLAFLKATASRIKRKRAVTLTVNVDP